MSLNWTSGDSSSQSASPVAGPSRTEHSTRPETDGLHAINEFDFETLIEILGTSGADKHSDGLDILKIQPLEEPFLQSDGNKLIPPASFGPDNAQTSTRGDANTLLAGPPAVPRSPLRVGAGGPKMPISPLELPPTDSIPPSQRDIQRSPQNFEAINHNTPGPDENRESVTGIDFTAASGFTRLNEELGTAVSGVKEQVMDLRDRIQMLKDEVKGFAPHLYHKAFDDTQARPDSVKQPHPSDGHRDDTKDLKDPSVSPSQAEGIGVKDPSVTVQSTVAGLSDEEARTALVNICQTLRIDPSTFASPQRTAMADPYVTIPPRTLNEVSRALQLVSDMNELVWRSTRRTRSGQGNLQDTHNVYGEENIRSLMDRVRLWERTARSRVDR